MESLAISPAHLVFPEDHPLRQLPVAIGQKHGAIEIAVFVRALLHLEDLRRLRLRKHIKIGEQLSQNKLIP